MPSPIRPEADTGLLLIDGLEIEPLPDGLLSAQETATSDFPGCCSCTHCSSGTEPPTLPAECYFWTLFEI